MSVDSVVHGREQDGSRSTAPLLNAANVSKAFGTTQAVDGVDLLIQPGTVLGLVGANGAGKSTLMRILAGVIPTDTGSLQISGEKVESSHYSPRRAKELGIRVVYQELSLCTNLSVLENFFLDQSSLLRGRGWRKAARISVERAIEDIFPDAAIRPEQLISDLTISQRQMVEIARAVSDNTMKLLILDEPTSSLGAEATTQLLDYISKKKTGGQSFIFISHRLKEVLALSDSILVMVNGKLQWSGAGSDANEEFLIQKMGTSASTTEDEVEIGVEDSSRVTSGDSKRLVTLDNLTTRKLKGLDAGFTAGEVVGIAGLEGSGQRDLLHAIYHGKGTRGVTLGGRVAFVSGDRSTEGLFQYWSIVRNMSLTKWLFPGSGTIIRPEKENKWAKQWFERLRIRAPHMHVPLISLSGGNQQKALIARALLSDADIVLLDDPNRGVDVDTKVQLYRLFREVAHEQGKLIIWFSSEDEELNECDRVLVMKGGHLVTELERDEISKDAIVNASFQSVESSGNSSEYGISGKRSSGLFSRILSQRVILPIFALALILIGLGFARPLSLSQLGLSLLVGAALPLVLASISQMFIIAGSDIDLGIGPFLGLTNVLSATVLVKNFWLGIAVLACSVLAYGALGALIHTRKIPAIVATLGASFIWLGIALSIQKEPGGSAPGWLENSVNISIPVIPESIILVVIFAYLSYVILMRSRYGIVLRGFGNNQKAIELSGWSTLKARVSLYMLAGFFGALGGLIITATSTAADANATTSYTLLSVAAVVLGGGELLGGIVSSVGTAFGAVSLSLLGALLGFLNIGSSYETAVQGVLLFVILGIRMLIRRESA